MFHANVRSPGASQRHAGRPLRMEALESRQLLAITPVMLTDSGGVESGTGSNPHGFTEANGVTYFTTGQPGRYTGDLWRTDGSAAGTTRVYAGMQNVGEMVNFNGTLYFAANRTQFGEVLLYRTDGTSGGTRLVRQANNQPVSSAPSDFVEVDDVLYFLCRSSSGVELWRTDGSTAGTFLVKGIPSGSSTGISRDDMKLANVDGTLFFKANDGVSGVELWKSDGTAAGTVQVKDIYPGALGGLRTINADVDDFVNVGGVLYFGADDGASGRELWRSDGTETGTFRVKDIRPGATSATLDQFTAFRGALFFTSNDGLWKSDGTEAGTTNLATTTISLQRLTVANNLLFFTAGTTSTTLARSDGTTAGTQYLQLRIGNTIGDNPRELTTVGDELYLIANTSAGPEIWRTNGLPNGTYWTGDALPNAANPQNLTNAGGKLYFAAAPPNGVWSELYGSDGTGPGTRFIKALGSESTSSLPKGLAELNGSLFFQANDFTQSKFWTTDGTTTGTLPFAASAPVSILGATTVGGVVFFTGHSAQSGRELWKTDGTAAGTSLVKEIGPGAANGVAENAPLFNANGTLYFLAYEPSTGMEVWKSDGTAAGTTLVKDLTPGVESSFNVSTFNRVSFTAVGEHVYFVVYANDRSQVWRTDGTDAGTVQVADFQWTIGNLVALGDSAYFAGFTPENGIALWKSTPGEAGITAVKSFAPWPHEHSHKGIFINSGQTLAVAGELIYFYADDGPNGYELWKSDGTTAGTEMTFESQPFNAPNFPPNPPTFVAVGSTMYFLNYAPNSAREIWKTDGTASGTRQVSNFPNQDPFGSTPFQAIEVNGELYFIADAPAGNAGNTLGRELWRTDGDGVTLVADLRPGTASSNIANLINVNGDLYFTANNGTHGEELWMAPHRTAIAHGDYDLSGLVDGDDFLAWQLGFGSSATPARSGADGDGDGAVDAGDLSVWKEHYGDSSTAATAAFGAMRTAAVATAAVSLDEEPPTAETANVATFVADGPAAAPLAAKDALFSAGDFSLLFCLTDDEADWIGNRRRGRAAIRAAAL